MEKWEETEETEALTKMPSLIASCCGDLFQHFGPRLPERSHCYGANFRREQESRAKASQPTMYSPPSRLRGKPRDLCGRCFRAAGVWPPQYPRPVAPCGRSRQSALQRGANLLALLLQSPKSIAQGRLCPCFPAPAPPRTKGDALLR